VFLADEARLNRDPFDAPMCAAARTRVHLNSIHGIVAHRVEENLKEPGTKARTR
jgi:hypothetical protein